MISFTPAVVSAHFYVVKSEIHDDKYSAPGKNVGFEPVWPEW